ncbi:MULTISPECIES: hypothetical protein [Leisingera]|uniref:hypothetical protein n=1 Tax=Leisingera TaxID=191028 RepID=UPI0004288EA7|nr:MULTISPECIES: hypothetical protein [Leisingera]OBY25680.1 hypothetical protein A9D60_21110 [Leisingera sp. JC1]UWQ85962.1 hypothetical protein K3726_21030 [Leisingera caerulea]
MAKTKYIIDTDIQAKAKVTIIDHAKLQKMRKGEKGVLFGKHSPDLKLMNASFEWDMDGKTKKAVGLSSVTLSIRYTGQIYLSKAIDKKSKCFSLVKAHEEEHQKICVKGVKAMNSACQKILQKHTDAMLRKYKGDYDAFAQAEAKAARKVAIDAYKEIDDGPFYKVAVKSLSIDTASNYAKISPHCSQFG